MLSEKPWKTDAVVRLFASVLLCVFMGTLVVGVINFFEASTNGRLVFFLGATSGALALFGAAVVVLGRPWHFEHLIRDLVILLVCVYGGLLLMWFAMQSRGQSAESEKSALDIVVAVLSFQGVALFLVGRFLREHHIGWAEAFGLQWKWHQAVFAGLVVSGCLFFVGWLLQYASASMMEHLHVQPQVQVPVQVLSSSHSWSGRVALGIAAILIAPTAEEMLFRGILYPAIKQQGYPRLAFWGTSVLFGAIHFNLAIFLPLTVLALLLTWLYERTDNLVAPITAHSCFNALNFLLLYASPWLENKFHGVGPS